MRSSGTRHTHGHRPWPASGRCILGSYDESTVVVYQAFRPSIGHYAAEHGHFGGDFRLERMSWIKPGFLWMMYRSGWGTKPGQEVTLAIWLRRSAFDEILQQAVLSAFVPDLYSSEEQWRRALRGSTVRLQWDPDHHPSGQALPRRAIQLGPRGRTLARYAREWIVGIEDISSFVAEQRSHVNAKAHDRLTTPSEAEYPIDDPDLARRLRLSPPHRDNDGQ